MSDSTPTTRGIILARSAALFADKGKDGVSMRDIAREVGVTIAALYHHFPDKQSLYLAAIVHAFGEKTAAGNEALNSPGTPWDRLRRFVEWMAKLLTEDQVFAGLLHRELLDGNEERLKVVTEKVFAKPLADTSILLHEIAPRQDAQMLAFSLVSLVLGHVQLRTIRRHVSVDRTPREDPQAIADHVLNLLLSGMEGMPDSVTERTTIDAAQNAK